MEIDDEITTDYEWIIAKRDTGHVAIHVPKGSINDVIHRYTATAKGEPFMTLEEIFYGEARPASAQPRMRAFSANVSSPLRTRSMTKHPRHGASPSVERQAQAGEPKGNAPGS